MLNATSCHHLRQRLLSNPVGACFAPDMVKSERQVARRDIPVRDYGL
jgi:hypothetical protein